MKKLMKKKYIKNLVNSDILEIKIKDGKNKSVNLQKKQTRIKINYF